MKNHVNLRTDQIAKLGSILIQIPTLLCATAPLVPPPYNTLALLACSLIPKSEECKGCK
jgi:hypothetical protein